jgi:hypothetical protein
MDTALGFVADRDSLDVYIDSGSIRPAEQNALRLTRLRRGAAESVAHRIWVIPSSPPGRATIAATMMQVSRT